MTHITGLVLTPFEVMQEENFFDINHQKNQTSRLLNVNKKSSTCYNNIIQLDKSINWSLIFIKCMLKVNLKDSAVITMSAIIETFVATVKTATALSWIINRVNPSFFSIEPKSALLRRYFVFYFVNRNCFQWMSLLMTDFIRPFLLVISNKPIRIFIYFLQI